MSIIIDLKRRQTVLHGINVAKVIYFSYFSTSSCSPSTSFPFISAFLQQPPLLRTATLPPALFHAHCVVFFLIALCCSSPFPTFRPITTLMGSDAGRDDSRTRFSLRVYYLCSGPFKTTQNGPGSQCGEFVLTSCLFLLLLLLSRSFLPSPPAPFGNQ